MYLVDTNVISELRKKSKANKGVLNFFNKIKNTDNKIYLSVITIGELRRGVDLIRHRGDHLQATQLSDWLELIIEEYNDFILPFGTEEAQVWGRLRVPHHENALDKQIAATALMYGLTIVTRNASDFSGLGISVFNPFE